jgi:predicted enzyme related to lactoylglutathione lyase
VFSPNPIFRGGWLDDSTQKNADDLRVMQEITQTRFVIAVPDLVVSSTFYRDILGFSIQSIPDPGFLFYNSGVCTIMAGFCPEALHPSKLGDHSYFAYLQIDDIDSFYEKVRAKGAQICKTIRNESWGMREFGIVTADGHRIMYASPKLRA